MDGAAHTVGQLGVQLGQLVLGVDAEIDRLIFVDRFVEIFIFNDMEMMAKPSMF